MKIKKLISLMLIAILLAGCGNKESTVEEKPVENTAVAAGETEEVKETEVAEEVQEEKSTEPNVYEDDTAKVVIKEYEFMKSQYDENVDIVALTIEFTNKSNEAIDPWFGTPLKAEQETDKTIELLNGANGLFPEDYKPDLVEASNIRVKPGATVEAVIGHELKFNDSPVFIRDWFGDYEYVLTK